MAENSVDPEPEWLERAFDSAEDTLVAMENLLATLRAFEDVLRQQDVSVASSAEYCDNFCQALMHYAGSRNSMDHGLPLLEVYCLSINCFATARSHLTAESDKVGLILKRLALSCFELFLSVPENEIPYEAWLQFHHSVQVAHGMLLRYGSTDLQALVQMTGEGGAWSNPVLTALLTGQPTHAEEVDAYICLEGEGFMEMRVKHLEKMGEVAKAVVLAKACTECDFISNKCTFRQTYVSLLCHLLPSEEAISEISRLDCKDVLDITCNLETDGDENTAFILCTTFLTQQLQQQSLYCSWELILLWSKLQRRLDPALLSFLERCLQLGAIAKTVSHLLYLVRVIQSEVEDLGVAPSVELCVKALQLPKQEDSTTQISVCKTVSCLLADDLEVCRACLLTEFLLDPSEDVFRSLEELYLRPDQKNDLENMVVPNSLRCELLLALKSYWPFDPEFWDWKTLKHQCVSLLGLKPDSEEEDATDAQVKCKLTADEEIPEGLGSQNRLNGVSISNRNKTSNSSLPEIQYNSKTKKGRFRCQICKRSVTDTQLVHHSKRHSQEHIHPCPICREKFDSRKQLIPHLNEHMHSAVSLNKSRVKAEREEKHSEEDEDPEPGEIPVDASLMMYYKSTHDPDVLEHIVQQVNSPKKHVDDDEHVTFDYIYRHYNLQNRDEYPCPGTSCSRVFKHSKYLNVHLKSEHRGDENVRYFQKMKDKREKCSFCRKHLMSAFHDRKHRKRHCGDEPYSCLVVGCGAQFMTSSELFLHKQTHGYQMNYQCELKGCYVTYAELGQLYHHEAQHFRDAAFTCTAPNCRKYYFSKKAFVEHLAAHKIRFSERDFEAQRKAKRKQFKSSMNDTSASQIKSDCALSLNGDLSLSSCASPSEPAEDRETKTTLVAVCFDGSKFTCGFEKCGMTFSRARDVQRHLKCTHPEHLKMENKEHKLNKSKGVKYENKGGANKELNEPKFPFFSRKTKKEKKTSSLGKHSESSVVHEALKEIINGLCKLDLTCSSHSEPPELSPETQPSEKPVLQNKPPPEGKEEICKSTPDNDGETGQKSLASDRPYACKLCVYRATKKCNLQRHYTRHGYTHKQSGKMASLYSCHLCPEFDEEKDSLRDHYTKIHNLDQIVVDEIICGLVGNVGNKQTNPPAKPSRSSSNPKSKETKPIEQDGNGTCEEEQDDLDKEQNTEEEEESDAAETHQGRARRMVAKGNLCYIMDKFSKPFHCVAKDCGAAFSAQGGLVRHLQTVHHYNRSQLLLENDCDEQSSEVKKEHSKKRSVPISDEPQPQYKCHFANCNVSYHLKSSLARHTRDCHSQPEVVSKYDGCTSAGQDEEQKKPLHYDHCEYYNSLVVRMQSTRKNSVSGCQKNIAQSLPQQEEPDPANTCTAQSSPNPEKPEAIPQANQSKRRRERTSLKHFVFKSHEEALQMCQDRCFPEAFPCLVQNCDTVVRHGRSLSRHYRQVHRIRKTEFDSEAKDLVMNAEQLEERIQRKSIRPTRASSPNGVRKMEYQTEPENPGVQSAPMSLHSLKNETPDETRPDPLGFPEEVEEERPSVERNGMLVGADDVLYGEPSTDGRTGKAAAVAQSSQKPQERLSLEQIKPFLRPVTVDLSPPSSLRLITERGFVDLSNKKAKEMIKEKLKNRTVSVSIPRIREPLKRKNDLSEQPSNVMDAIHNPPHITAYKPINFESSILNFIKETVPKENGVTATKRQNSFRRSCSVKENNGLGITHTRKRTHSPLRKPHAASGDTSKFKSIVDKALVGCGDLAVKQLLYLRPVVVLGKPVCCSTLTDAFAVNTKKRKLLLGS